MKRGGPLRRVTPLRARSKKRQALPTSTRRAVWDRCGGRCEACGHWLPRHEMQIHHRKLRSQGGLNDLNNLLALHRDCHTGPHGVHMHPERSYSLGHLVHAHDDPSFVPIVLFPLMYATPWKTEETA